MAAIGERIRRLRLDYGMSQVELARRAKLSKTSMNNLEKGETTDPHLSHVIRIADVLRVSLDTLVGREVHTHGS